MKLLWLTITMFLLTLFAFGFLASLTVLPLMVSDEPKPEIRVYNDSIKIIVEEEK